jgi:hypothetical protein
MHRCRRGQALCPPELEDVVSAVKDLKTLLHEDLDELKALRDEARLHLHLAGMEAKAYFAKLEARLEDLEERLMPDGRAEAVNAALRLGNQLREELLRFKKDWL